MLKNQRSIRNNGVTMAKLRIKTRSAAYMLGASGDYPGHTAVIMLDGISGCYALDRVREASK